MASIEARVGIVETKIENLGDKLDDLKSDVKDMHECLDNTREGIQEKLDKMYETSCDQHASLGKEVKELKREHDRLLYTFGGGIIVVSFLSNHFDKIITLFG